MSLLKITQVHFFLSVGFVEGNVIWGEECERQREILSRGEVVRLEMREKKKKKTRGEAMWGESAGEEKWIKYRKKTQLPCCVCVCVSPYSYFPILLSLSGYPCYDFRAGQRSKGADVHFLLTNNMIQSKIISQQRREWHSFWDKVKTLIYRKHKLSTVSHWALTNTVSDKYALSHSYSVF